MTYNEKKRFLEGYVYSMRRVKSLLRELEEWQTIATNITQKITPVTVKNHDSRSRIEDCAIRIAGIEQTLIEEIEQAEYNKKTIEDSIDAIKNPRRREIIEMRYVHAIPVSKIASDFNKGEDNIYKIIRKTIKSMDI